MIDAISEGALVDKILEQARQQILNTTINSQQFGNKFDPTLIERGNEINALNTDNQWIENRLHNLTSMIRWIVMNQA